MRKSTLIKELDGIAARNNELFLKCRDLEKSLTDADSENYRLKLEIESLKAENEILRQALSDFESKLTENVVSPPEIQENELEEPNESVDIFSAQQESEVSTVKYESEPQSVSETISNGSAENYKPLLDESVLKLASACIGRVVLKSTELCNGFAAEGSINSKDLINLALGRTEVFKSEVLTLVNGDIAKEDLNDELKSKEVAVYEYFDMLIRQQ